jgi:phosphatidylserine decarboxylase
VRFAPEGRPFIGASTGILAALAALAWMGGGGWWIGVTAWLPVAVWTPAFFRDPPRHGPQDQALIVAPADGRIVSVTRVPEPDFLGAEGTRVSVFMNVFNVHINYYPVSGQVAYRHYRPGAFLNATLDKASERNEQMSLGIESPRGRVLVRQIAGLIARRIVTDPEVGADARQGARFGLIRFGSRVDTFLPAGAEASVRVGDRATGGVTVIGQWNT